MGDTIQTVLVFLPLVSKLDWANIPIQTCVGSVMDMLTIQFMGIVPVEELVPMGMYVNIML
jgi:hypothetical protein